MRTEMNCMMLYNAMYLKTEKLVVSAHRPSHITLGTHSMLGV